MSPTRLAECLRACVGDAAAPVLCPPCRSLPGRAGLGAPMVDTRTSRLSCRLGRRASCRQVGAGDSPKVVPGCGTWDGYLWWDRVAGLDLLSATALESPYEPLNEVGVGAGRIRPFFQMRCSLRARRTSCLFSCEAQQKKTLLGGGPRPGESTEVPLALLYRWHCWPALQRHAGDNRAARAGREEPTVPSSKQVPSCLCFSASKVGQPQPS